MTIFFGNNTHARLHGDATDKSDDDVMGSCTNGIPPPRGTISLLFLEAQ